MSVLSAYEESGKVSWLINVHDLFIKNKIKLRRLAYRNSIGNSTRRTIDNWKGWFPFGAELLESLFRIVGSFECIPGKEDPQRMDTYVDTKPSVLLCLPGPKA